MAWARPANSLSGLDSGKKGIHTKTMVTWRAAPCSLLCFGNAASPWGRESVQSWQGECQGGKVEGDV